MQECAQASCSSLRPGVGHIEAVRWGEGGGCVQERRFLEKKASAFYKTAQMLVEKLNNKAESVHMNEQKGL